MDLPKPLPRILLRRGSGRGENGRSHSQQESRRGGCQAFLRNAPQGGQQVLEDSTDGGHGSSFRGWWVYPSIILSSHEKNNAPRKFMVISRNKFPAPS